MAKSDRYGLRPSFVHSGDMRLLLASAVAGTGKRDLFEKTRAFDDLIREEKGAQRSTLYYNEDALEGGKLFRKRVEALKPLKVPPMYSDGSCVLAGAGPSLRAPILEEAHKRGIPVIAIGNAIAALPFADYWIGSRDVLDYHPSAFSSQHTVSFVLEQHFNKPLYDFKRNKPLSVSPETLPANLSIKAFSGTVDSFISDPRELSFMRVRTSTTLGISLAAALGFSNIVMSGVDLSDDVSEFYFSGDIPKKETLDRKSRTYASLKQVFPTIFKNLSEIGVRLSAINRSPFDIPVYPENYFMEFVRHNATYSSTVQLSDIFKTSAADVRGELSKQEKTKNSVVRPNDLVALVPKLKAEATHIFPADVLNKIAEDLENAAKTSGCSSCKKNGIVRPLYNLFEKAALESPEKLAPVWEKYLPHKHVVQIRTIQGDSHGKYIYRQQNVD